EQVSGTTGDRPALGEPRHAIRDDDVEAPETVLAVRHPSCRHRIGDQGDVVRPDEFKDVAHDSRVQVHAVTDEFNDDLPTAGRSERRRYRPAPAVGAGPHPAEGAADGSAPTGSAICGA